VVVSHDMNSVMEIGEYVMFLHEGAKLWEGSNQDIDKTDIPELNEFLFPNKLMRAHKK
jgi:phospholipid/cholesterol/gamma-HCH transport system ATP-binding protein